MFFGVLVCCLTNPDLASKLHDLKLQMVTLKKDYSIQAIFTLVLFNRKTAVE